MLSELAELLQDEDFQDPRSGLMSFPAYLYAYPPEKEYAFRRALQELVDSLKRPSSAQQDVYVVDFYDYFVDHLRNHSLASTSLLDLVLEKEEGAKDKTDRLIREQLDRDAIYQQLVDNFRAYCKKQENSRLSHSYFFIHGFGKIYPYLRCSTFMSRMEKHVEGYKLILFYPGTWKNGRLSFLGELPTEGAYRATCLNEKLAL